MIPSVFEKFLQFCHELLFDRLVLIKVLQGLDELTQLVVFFESLQKQ